MKTLLLLFALSHFYLAYSQSNQIQVEFILEGEKIDFQNQDIEIYFVCGNPKQKIIIKPMVVRGNFSMPDLCGNTEGHIIIKLRNKAYGFGYNNLEFNQDMRLVFGVDEVPYEKEYYIESVEQEKTKAIVYVEFHPIEKGEGTVTAINILNFKNYLEETEKLLR